MKTNSTPARLAVHARTIATPRHLLFRRAWLCIGFLAFATIAFSPQPAHAAVTEAWVHRFSNLVGNTTDEAVKVVRDAAGDIIVTGSTAGGIPGDGRDMLTIKYSGADGSVLWQQRYNGPADTSDRPSALAVDGSGNVVVTGHSEHPSGSGEFDFYTAKYAATDDTLLWERRGPEIRYFHAVPATLAVDGNGNVVVTGHSGNGTNRIDYYTAKYAAAEGALLWEKLGNGVGTGVAVDVSGNVVITGSSYNGTNREYYTAKYAAADGALLWEKRYNGPANLDDYATAVAVDGSGNVVVTGTSWNDEWPFDTDPYTAKYAAADGALLWEKRYIGPANSGDFASAVAVDGSGNVVVTGRSHGTNYSDYFTAKYASADGVLLWEKHYNGPANSGDEAKSVAVDGSGNVVVTGNSRGGNTTTDFYTAKYASADGGLLWEKRFTGPASVAESPHCLALGPDGMVAVTGSSLGRDGYANAGYTTVVYREVPPVPVRQLIINGGFEAPDTPTYMEIYAGQNTIAPWVVGGHSVSMGDAAGNGFISGPAFEGDQMLDLNGLGRGRLTQAFATTPGLLYTLTFAYSNNYYNSFSPASARVRVFDGLGVRLNQTITHDSSVAGNYDWTVFAAEFTAVQNTTILEFISLSDTNGATGGIMLDAVQVFEGALKIDSITRAGNGLVMLEVRGFPNAVHRIQASVDLSAGSFIDIATVTADADGLFQFEDTPADLTQKYYRVVYS